MKNKGPRIAKQKLGRRADKETGQQRCGLDKRNGRDKTAGIEI